MITIKRFSHYINHVPDKDALRRWIIKNVQPFDSSKTISESLSDRSLMTIAKERNYTFHINDLND